MPMIPILDPLPRIRSWQTPDPLHADVTVQWEGPAGTSHTAAQGSLGPGHGAEGRRGVTGAVPDDLAAR